MLVIMRRIAPIFQPVVGAHLRYVPEWKHHKIRQRPELNGHIRQSRERQSVRLLGHEADFHADDGSVPWRKVMNHLRREEQTRIGITMHGNTLWTQPTSMSKSSLESGLWAGGASSRGGRHA